MFALETHDERGKWRVSLDPEAHGVRIQSVEHGRFLAYSGNRLYTVHQPECSEDNVWHLEPGHRNYFFVSITCHDKRLSSTKDNPCTHSNRQAWEKWAIDPNNEQLGHFEIRSLEDGKYLGSTEDGKLVVIESSQLWTIGSSPYGGVYIHSVEHGGRLSCDADGHPYTTTDSGRWETWKLEPIMPITISGKQIFSLVGIGVTSITLAVATPFAVMGVVGAMGFGAEGIAAGSMAAGMMSAEAIASGGGVIAGGTVAALQSIGAAGLGAAGITAAAGTGAAVGGSAALGITAAAKGLDSHKKTIVLQEPEQDLPLCSWRVWGQWSGK